MANVTAMAATYTPVSREEMDKYIRRSFRALNPKPGSDKGELYYDLTLAPGLGVRIWTSISSQGEAVRGVGKDAIRVQFFNFTLRRPLIPGAAEVVKRTQGWRDNLRDRVEKFVEMYEEKPDYWESRTIAHTAADWQA